jgi:hypothetical protein
MKMLLWFIGVGVLMSIWILAGGLITSGFGDPAGTVTGTVVDETGVVGGALVRVRATETSTTTGLDGHFVLQPLVAGQEVEVTAWAEDHYIASSRVVPPASGVVLTMRRHHTTDHPDYQWIAPESGASASACNNCHPMIVSQWAGNAHGRAVSNGRFFSMYNGTDLKGKTTVLPGYTQDFPGTTGNCANCHAPGAAVDGYLTTDMNKVRNQVTAGIHCDYCHKIGGAYLNPATGSVYPNAPGTQGLKVLRPPPGDNIFIGPYDDIHDPDTYAPIMTRSEFCAPCHQFSFWGTPIYESFNEWRASSYAVAGITCQVCHMPPNGDRYFALPEKGGLEHPPEKTPSHLDLGLASKQLMQNTVKLKLSAKWASDGIKVTVVLTNTGAGHHVPTDFPGRNMILVLKVKDKDGNDLEPLAGSPKVPQWGGNLAGLSGKGYAKILRDVATGESPVISYWKQTAIESDNRIPANGKDTSRYVFALPTNSDQVSVSAELRFRRLFQALKQAKGWNSPDILMEQAKIVVEKPS